MGHETNPPPVEPSRSDESAGLSTSRADFSSSLSKRIDALYDAIAALEQQPESTARRDYLLQRLHALHASAKVLGFASAADVLARGEQRLRTAQVDTLVDDLSRVRRHLADLPGMVQRGSYSLAPQPHSEANSRHPASARTSRDPLSVLLFGTETLATALLQTQPPHSGFEITSSTSSDELRPLAAALGPDVIILDAAQGSISLLIDDLTQSSETATVPIVALNVPDEIASSLEELGVSATLSSRATDNQIIRTLYSTRRLASPEPKQLSPFGELSLPELATRIAQEIKHGLVDGAVEQSLCQRVSLGEGTEIRAAIWSAIAQIREHLVEQSDGALRFDRGPDGSIPLAPGPRTFARGQSRTSEPVDLTGRRILVTDDDPAVAWLVGGTLRAAGAIVTEAHDGSRALELAYRLWPEVIVSDILMPGLDGFALCHLIKRDVLLRDVPVVLLSWKEDLLFRLRDLGSDADDYLRKEATASTIVRRVQELLGPRRALELRIARSLSNSKSPSREARGRLDSTTVRQLLEVACNLERPVRIALRDSTALYDLRVREGSLKALTRTFHDGTVAHGHSVLMELVGVTAGRFSVTPDLDPLEPEFDAPLQDLLKPYAIRARAVQRVLSGLNLGLVDKLVLEPDAFGESLPTLPLSLRPVADELRRGTPPRSLLASGVASVHVLESLLADVARRGKVRAILGVQGDDLLGQEILSLAAMPAAVPPKPAPAPTPLFTFQLSPAPPEVRPSTPPQSPREAPHEDPEPTASLALSAPKTATLAAAATEQVAPAQAAQLEDPPAAPRIAATRPSNAQKLGKPPAADDIDWAMELSWDSTPPPTSPVAEDSREFPASKPATSGGFMRPSLATLDRRAPGETPDLANAVALAVSATPAPSASVTLADSLATRDTKTAGDTETEVAGISEAAPVVQIPDEQSKPAATAMLGLGLLPNGPQLLQPSADLGGLRPMLPAAPKPAPERAPDPAPEPVPERAPTVSQLEPVQEPFASTAAVTSGPAPDAPDDLSRTAPLVNPPPLTPIESVSVSATPSPSFSTSTSAVVSTLSIPKAEVAIKPAAPEELAPAGGATGPNALLAEPTKDPVSTALPVIHAPPRPGARNAREYDSDPVFPLVSAAPPAVSIQPAIDVGDSLGDAREPAAIEADLASAAANRDTLRSPGDSTPAPARTNYSAKTPLGAGGNEKAEVASDSVLNPEEPPPIGSPELAPPKSTQPELAQPKSTQPELAQPKSTQSKSTPPDLAPPGPTPPEPGSARESAEPDSSKSSAPAAPQSTTTSEPRASAASEVQSTPSHPRTRQISWIQALGLSFLAGIVTFALTVPIVRWWKERGRLQDTAAAVSAEFVAPATAPAQLEPMPSASAAPPNASLEPAPRSATVEDIPVPPDVTLAQGQGLLEVVTAGGHAVFLDDSFVGRGPVRVVTVAPGRHVVRTRLNGVERTDSVEIGAGQSKRLSLEKAWK